MTVRVQNRAAILGVDAGAAIIERRRLALDMADAALEAVDAQRCTASALERIAQAGIDVNGATVFAFGKAAIAMTQAVLARHTISGGVVHALGAEPLAGVRVVQAGHPVPAADAAQQGQAVLDLAQSLEAGDTALCLISGGGSAMLEAPRTGVTMTDIATATRRLMGAGADIHALNAARVRMSRVKGGGLAHAMQPARIVNIILSDVVDGPADVVASGPTLADDIEDIHTVIAADNRTAITAACDTAIAHGVAARLVEAPITGEAYRVGKAFHRRMTAATVAGGETTVTVTGDGRGGRNQEFVVGALLGFRGGLTMSFGTDGIDGYSTAAGAFVDEHVVQQVRRGGLDPVAHLERNDSNTLLARVGAVLETGPTGTNVADVFIHLM